ncbi:uncharacterized protein METZ01_LOCUS483328, partial [marine metagenome]
MADDVGFDEPEMSWSTQDFEQKIGFTGGRYTETNAFFTFLVGLIMATVFFLFLEFVITDSGSDLEWAEKHTTAEGKVEDRPIHIFIADKFIN